MENDDGTYDEDGLEHARSLCDSCPARKRCLLEANRYEQGKPPTERFGIAAGMTPEQRRSAVLRKQVTCPKCDAQLDPALVRNGILRCPRNKAHLNRTTVPIPNEGDGWSKRHLTLARRVLHYMDEHPRQRTMPSITALSDEMGERWHDTKRVYQAFLVDGTLGYENGKYVRKLSRSKRVAADKWLPPHLVVE